MMNAEQNITNLYKQLEIFILLIYICIPLLIIHILKTFNIIGTYTAYTVFLIVFFIGLYIFMRKVYDISQRSNMNVTEYNNEITDIGLGGGPTTTSSILSYDKNQLSTLGENIKDIIKDESNTIESKMSAPYPTMPTGGDGPLS